MRDSFIVVFNFLESASCVNLASFLSNFKFSLNLISFITLSPLALTFFCIGCGGDTGIKDNNPTKSSFCVSSNTSLVGNLTSSTVTSSNTGGNSGSVDTENATEGLEYCLNSDEESCSVVGIGSAMDSDIVILSTVIGKPVTSIRYGAFYTCPKLKSVAFKNVEGWFVAENKTATSGANLSGSDLLNTSTAATYLTLNYKFYYWKRNV